MATYDTPEPILVALDLGVGSVHITASERRDTTVEVRASDPAKPSDVAAAEQTRVDHAGGRLSITAPKGWRRYAPGGGAGSIAVEIGLPAGSRVTGDGGVVSLHCSGRLGECRYKSGVGDITVDSAGSVHLSTGVGDIELHRASGHADVRAASGALRIGTVEGTAVVRCSNGSAWVGEVTGDLRVVSANGSISVDHARATVAAKTANGDIRLAEVSSGTVVASTALGKVDIGIRDGVAAWLDVDTRFGTVRNTLDAAGAPAPGEATVEIRARSGFGDITVHHAAGSLAGTAPG